MAGVTPAGWEVPQVSQISALIPHPPALPQSPASLQQSLWKVGEEEEAKHFKGSAKLL